MVELIVKMLADWLLMGPGPVTYKPWVALPISKINVYEFQIDKVSQTPISHGLANGKAGNEQW